MYVFILFLFCSLSDDAVRDLLRAVFLASGKGRRPKLPPLPLTDKLLLCVLELKDEGGKTYDEAAVFLSKLFPQTPVGRLRYLLVSANGKKETTSSSAPAVRLQHDSLGPFLQGVDRACLLEGALSPCRNPTFGLLKDLLSLKRKENSSFATMCQWWRQLTGTSVGEATMAKAATRFSQKNAKLRSSASQPAGKEIYDNFLLSPPFPSSSAVPSTSKSPPPSASAASTASSEGRQPTLSNYVLKLAEGAKQLYAVRRKADELQTEVDSLRLRCTTLHELNQDNHTELQALRSTNAQLVRERDTLKDKVAYLELKILARNQRVEDITRKLNYAKDKGVEKKLQRRETKLEEMQAQLLEREVQLQQKADIERELREQLRKQQVAAAGVKRQLNQVKNHIEEAEALPVYEEDDQDVKIIRLKNDLGHFKKEAKVVMMALMGECEVPAHRCGAVVKAVVENICDGRIPVSDLPSQRSALRFADQMHVLSKAHVADTLQKTDHWDLHIDGTSRNGVKYVCQQVTTSEGTLSLGFTPVATEDTSTLVDVTIQMLEEISDIYSGEDAQQMFVQMLVSLTSIMSDRAAVMKSFARSLQVERRLLLQTDEGLEFLHCNAHYLLGLGVACKNVLTSQEKESGEKLGRDAMPRFSSYKSTECSAFR